MIYVPRCRRRPAGASRARSRRLALVRLSGRQSDRAAHGRPGRRRPHGVAPLVLSDSGGGRAARSGARDRAAQPRSAAGQQDALRRPDAARSRAEDAARRARGGSRWSTRPTAPFRTCRASTPGTIELVRAPGRRRRVVRRSRSSSSRRTGATRPSPSHRAAADKLYRVKDRAFEAAAARIARRRADDRVRHAAVDVAVVRGGRADQRLGAERVGAGKRGQPALPAHRAPQPRRFDRDELLLLDLWGKLETPGAVFADITWVGFTGAQVPDEMTNAFAAVRDARDAAVRRRRGRRAARAARCAASSWIARRGRSSRRPATATTSCIARATASGETVHGNGAHLDDYETHDERRLLPGTGFTIEPGIYFDRFGVRTEINVVWGASRTRSDRPAPAGNRRVGVAETGRAPSSRREWRTSMSSRKTTVFYGLLIARRVARRRHGDRVAPRSVAAVDGAAGHRRAGDQQRAARRADRRERPSATSRRSSARRSSTSAPSRGSGRRSSPSSSAAAATTCSSASSAAARASAARARQRSSRASRSRSPPAPASSSARTASSSPTITSSKARPRSRSTSTATTPTSSYQAQGHRPRPAHRQRAHRAHREAEARAGRSEVRRLGADGARRLGHGDRQPVQPRAHGQRRRRQRGAAGRPAGRRRPLRRRHSDRRGDQPRQLRRSAAERARRGDRHQHRDLLRLAVSRATSASASRSRSTSCAICCRSCAAARSRAA